ncbi:MAG: hypothetical protein WBN40_02645 [Pseudomonadales bacterium]
MNTFASIATALGLCAALACQAAPTPSASRDHQRLASNEAYVLVDLGARGEMRHYVSSLNFSDKGAGIKVTIPKAPGMQLVKVKAGTYQPEAFGLKAPKDEDRSKRLAQKYAGEGIKIEAGTVTYIGNWNVKYGQRVRWIDGSHLVDAADYSVYFAPRDVEAFYRANEWIGNYPLRVAHMNGKRVASAWIFNEQELESRRLAQASITAH